MRWWVVILGLAVAACGRASDGRTVIRYSGSAVGDEGKVLAAQLDRFRALHPELDVELVPTPDSADQRHQLYVQWLESGEGSPDVLELDVVWAPELAAAGWIRPLDDRTIDRDAFFPAAIAAASWQDHIYAVPLVVGAGMLYWRTDLLDHPPTTFAELDRMARDASAAHGVRYGMVWQGARYEGLICDFLEQLAGRGGTILGPDGRLALDSDAALRALTFMRDQLAHGIVPEAALGWQEEQTRFAFQNGDAVFMRNWSYAYPLMQDPAKSRVAGKFAVAPMPSGPGGSPTATLGGIQLAINAHSAHPDAAWLLMDYLTRPEQMIERARVAGEYPPRPALYRSGQLAGALPIPPADALRVIEHAAARPSTPVYAQLSAAIQVPLHRALSGQADPHAALAAATRDGNQVLDEANAPATPAGTPQRLVLLALFAAVGVFLAVLAARRLRAPPPDAAAGEERLAWLLVAPAVAVVLTVALFPLLWTGWESLHAHDLRMPWRGRPFVGVAHYARLAGDARLWAALGHTALFTAVSVTLELGFGLVLALIMHRARRGRGAIRAVALIPWALPTVVAALVWRFMFSDAGVVNAVLVKTHAAHGRIDWLVDATLAWIPVILADVWKTTPFVALLLLAGLQNIDGRLYDAAATDGAGPWQQLRHVTLPLLRPALLVVLVFRTLDAFRVFDLIYVLTGGGPGTATEPVSLLSFTTLMRDLRFGRGAALAVIVFAIAFGLALIYVRLLGDEDHAR